MATLLLTKAVQPGMVTAEEVWQKNQLILQENTVLTANVIHRLVMWGIQTIQVKDIAKDSTDGEHNRLAVVKTAMDEDDFVFLQQYTKAVKLTDKLFVHMRTNETLPYEAFRELAMLSLNQLSQRRTVLANLYKAKPFIDYTSRHAVDTGIIAGALGSWLGLPVDQVKMLILSGLLHDIGKTRIPRSILEKPGRLTPTELENMKLHTVYGYYLASKAPAVPTAVQYAILQHHERENGEGYPQKLLSHSIHTYAKIVAVADVYNAMTTERVFQKSVTPFTALETLFNDMYVRLDKKCCMLLIRNICHALLGATVLLSDGSQAEIVHFPHFMSAKPTVIRKNGQVIDLHFNNRLSVVEVLTFRERRRHCI